MKKLLLPIAAVAAIFLYQRWQDTSSRTDVPESDTYPSAAYSDAVAEAFENQQSGIEVSGEGTVSRILGDDNDGDRHQRFVLALGSGQTLLVAHNIDVAPRIESLAVGDQVSFHGVYEWNDKGGVVHWTHHDPQGQHEAGWLRHRGHTYR
jgi:uncharacterized protein DUF3465